MAANVAKVSIVEINCQLLLEAHHHLFHLHGPHLLFSPALSLALSRHLLGRHLQAALGTSKYFTAQQASVKSCSSSRLRRLQVWRCQCLCRVFCIKYSAGQGFLRSKLQSCRPRGWNIFCHTTQPLSKQPD